MVSVIQQEFSLGCYLSVHNLGFLKLVPVIGPVSFESIPFVAVTFLGVPIRGIVKSW